MISAFGVEHGEISKSWKKLQPKLAKVNAVARKDDDLPKRFRVNYSQWRYKSGALQRDVNPHRFDRMDEQTRTALGRSDLPDARTIAARRKGEAATHKKAKNLKEGAQAMITGHANATKRDRFLP